MLHLSVEGQHFLLRVMGLGTFLAQGAEPLFNDFYKLFVALGDGDASVLLASLRRLAALSRHSLARSLYRSN
jgi:hypothetical protein